MFNLCLNHCYLFHFVEIYILTLRGVLSFFSSYACLDPASTVYKQKISGISGIPFSLILATPQKYPHSVYLPQERIIKCAEMTTKTSPAKKYSQNLHKK